MDFAVLAVAMLAVVVLVATGLLVYRAKSMGRGRAGTVLRESITPSEASPAAAQPMPAQDIGLTMRMGKQIHQ